MKTLKVVLAAIIVLVLTSSCQKEPMEVSFKISSLVPMDFPGTWKGVYGLKYRYSLNGETFEGEAVYTCFEETVILEGGEEFILEAWNDNPESFITIETRTTRTKKQKHNSFRIKN